MKSPLRKLRGFGLPHNNKEGKDRRPPSWTSSPTPPRFPNSFQFIMWRGAGRECEPKSGGSLGSCGFAASFLLSVYTHFFCNFWALLGTVNHSYRCDLAGSIERIIFGSVIQVDGPVQRTNLFLSVIIR
jgi:hypothetical protein